MSIEQHIRKNLSESKMMQIATVGSAQPWICTVYFVEDEQLNLYWLSLPSRRHSAEIEANPRVAIAVPVKVDQPVIGIQAEGTAKVINDLTVVQDIMKLYVERYNAGKDFYDNFLAGNNQHRLYKFTPSQYVLFDEVNFKGNPRQEFVLSKKN